jgi:hypothetical protein
MTIFIGVIFFWMFFSIVFLNMTNNIKDIKDILISKNKREKENNEHFHEIVQSILITERKMIERINRLEKIKEEGNDSKNRTN